MEKLTKQSVCSTTNYFSALKLPALFFSILTQKSVMSCVHMSMFRLGEVKTKVVLFVVSPHGVSPISVNTRNISMEQI